MTWGELRTLAVTYGVKDSDEVFLHQRQEYSSQSEIVGIEDVTIPKKSKIRQWLIVDSDDQREYISPCEATGR